MKPHKHAKVIKAWADGHAIECSSSNDNNWENAHFPAWTNACDYRIKAKFKVDDLVTIIGLNQIRKIKSIEWINDNSKIKYWTTNGNWSYEHDLELAVINIKPKFKVGDIVTFTNLSYCVEKTIKSIKIDTQNIVYFFTDGSSTEFEDKLQLVPTIPFTFEDAEMLIGRVIKNNEEPDINLILAVSVDGIETRTTFIPFDGLAKHYTFLDGTLCSKSTRKG